MSFFCILRQAKQQRERREDNPTASIQQRGQQTDGIASADGSSNQDSLSFWPSWGRVSSSESEYSDSEGGQMSKLRSASSKVRQASLGCLHSVVKVRRFKNNFFIRRYCKASFSRAHQRFGQGVLEASPVARF